MSTTTPPAVPYQAYRSKRHSRTASAVLAPNVPPPTLSRPASIVSNGPVLTSLDAQAEFFDTEKDSTEYSALVAVMPHKPPLLDLVPQPVKELPSPPSTDSSPLTPDSPHVYNKSHDPTPAELEPLVVDQPSSINGKSKQVESTFTSPVTSPSSSSTPLPLVRESGSSGSVTSKKITTFRRLQPRPSAGRSPLPSSPLRPPEVQSRVPSASPSITCQFDRSPPPPKSPALHSRVTSISSVISDDKPHSAAQPTGPSPSHTPNSSVRVRSSIFVVPQTAPGPGILQPSPRSSSMLVPPQPPPKTVSLASTSLSISPAASPPVSTPPLPPVALRSSAPYIPGFQPKGVYRPRTDEFAEARKAKSEANRVERTKLERRLEKLINLHFPIEGSESKDARKAVTERRRSALFDLDFASLRNMDASEIWKGVVQSQALQGAKGDIRAAEQRISPWQEDSDVSKCPLCNASFHPITNRKHHCRLCGQIICSLPVKRGQRLEPCSILFVVDSKTRKIEEVGEGVDYGVTRKGGTSNGKGNGKGKGKGKEKDEALADDEKFLKGVRVCRSCKPILSREQFYQEVSRIPILLRLYEAFIGLEKETEEALPEFQELLLTLNSDTAPTKEASAARKRILEDFASYDALSKRIRMLPCTPGSSQDRVQLAIRTRADLFLQKNMFPLQSIPKTKKQTSSPSGSDPATPLLDPDSELAHALQPLLEQEALLESFIGEAMAHRKFEDAKTLKANLQEIRAEIDRMVENGAGGMKGTAQAVG